MNVLVKSKAWSNNWKASGRFSYWEILFYPQLFKKIDIWSFEILYDKKVLKDLIRAQLFQRKKKQNGDGLLTDAIFLLLSSIASQSPNRPNSAPDDEEVAALLLRPIPLFRAPLRYPSFLRNSAVAASGSCFGDPDLLRAPWVRRSEGPWPSWRLRWNPCRWRSGNPLDWVLVWHCFFKKFFFPFR